MQGWAEFWESHAASSENPVVADGYCIEGVPLTREVLAAMAEDISAKLDLSPLCTLLEAGCGSGLLLSLLEGKFSRASGCDLSCNMIKKAKVYLPSANLCVSEVLRLPYRAGYFDRVLCYSVFLCFPTEQYAKETIVELLRVTKPGGKILIGELSDPEKLPEYHREKERLGLKAAGNGSKNQNAPEGENRLRYLNLSPSFFHAFMPSLEKHCAYKILPQNIHGKITSILRYDVRIDVHGH